MSTLEQMYQHYKATAHPDMPDDPNVDCMVRQTFYAGAYHMLALDHEDSKADFIAEIKDAFTVGMVQ